MRIPFSNLCARLTMISALAVMTTLTGCGDSEEAAPAADTGSGGAAPAGGQVANSGGGEDYEGGDYEDGGDDNGGGGGEHGEAGRMANNNAAMAPPGMGGGGMVNNNAAMAPPGMGGGGMVNNNAAMAPPPGMGGGGGSGGGEHGDDEAEAGMMAFGGGRGGEEEGYGTGSGNPLSNFGGGGGFPPPAGPPTKDYAMWTRADFVSAVRNRDRHVIAAIDSQSESRIGDAEFASTLTDVLGEMAGGSSMDALEGKPGFPAGMEPGGALRNNGGLTPPGGASLDQAIPMLRKSYSRPLDSFEAMLGEAMLGYAPQASQGVRNAAGRFQQGASGAPAPGGMSIPGEPGGGSPGGSEHGDDGGGAAGMRGQFGGGPPGGDDAAGMMQQFGGGRGGQGGLGRGLGGPPGGGQGQGAPGGGIQPGLTPTELVQSVVRALVRNNTDGAWKTLMRIVKGTQPTTLSSDENIGIVLGDTFSATTINAAKTQQILSASANQAMASPSGHPTTLAMLGSISSRTLDHYLGMQEASSTPVGGSNSAFGGQSSFGGQPSFGGQGSGVPGGSSAPPGRGPASFNGTSGGGGSGGPPAGRGPAGFNGTAGGGGGPSGFNGTAGGGGSSGPPAGRGPAGFNGTAGGGGGPSGFNGTAGGGGGIPGRPGAASPGNFGGGGEEEYENGFGGQGFGLGQPGPPALGPPTPTVNLTRDGIQPAAMALWSPAVTEKIAQNVLNNSSPEMLQIATSIPTANVRRALFESFKSGYDAGADDFISPLNLNAVDPGLLGVLKGLSRVRPARSNAEPSPEQAVKDSWVQATRSMVMTLRDRLRGAAGNSELNYTGASKIRLHRGAEVEQSIMLSVPNDATAELGASAPAKMNIYYLRTSVTPQTAGQRESLAKHYEKSAKGFRRVYAQEGMLWFDGVTRNSDGTRQTMDVIIQADGAAASNNGGGFPGGGGGFPGAAGSFPGSGGGDDYEGSSGPPGVGGALGPGSRQGGGAALGSTFTIEVIVTIIRDPQDPISGDASLTSAGLEPERR